MFSHSQSSIFYQDFNYSCRKQVNKFASHYERTSLYTKCNFNIRIHIHFHLCLLFSLKFARLANFYVLNVTDDKINKIFFTEFLIQHLASLFNFPILFNYIVIIFVNKRPKFGNNRLAKQI